MHLTFTFGDRLTETRIVTLLAEARRAVNVAIELGAGAKRVRQTWCIAWDLSRHIYMFAAPLRQTIFTEKYALSVANVLPAIDLVERCGIAQGHVEEMWAYVFVGGRHVGYIWTQRGGELGLRDATGDV